MPCLYAARRLLLMFWILFAIEPASSQTPAGIPRPKLDCGALNQLSVNGVTSIRAEAVTSGVVKPPTGSAIKDLPPFCRVQIVASPVVGSDIHMEVWLPINSWNGRFLGTGNGGGGGRIYFPPLRAGLKRGFVTANTDLGTAPGADSAVGQPEKCIDFGYRATHVMTVIGKSVLSAYFGTAAKYSYFWGSSTGGQQAMSEAQRYPGDYDGIIAGSAAINRTHLHSEFVWNYLANHKIEGQSALTAQNVADLEHAILSVCAGHDGGAPTDDFLTDPRVCKFDPNIIPLCGSTTAVQCMTAPQRDALIKLYAGPTNPRTRERIYAPIPFGSEASSLGITFQESPSTAHALLYPFLWAFGAGFNLLTFDFDKDEATLDSKLAPILNANSPDLSAFQRRGGKLIMYTGTADPIVPFPDEINYYERVVRFEQNHPQPHGSIDPLAETRTFFRLYVIPGMGHGGGGPGLNSFGQLIQPKGDDVLYALEQWVEHGLPPDQFPAVGWNDANPAKGIRLRRNVCPYPAFPTYVSGDASQASSFDCQVRARGLVAEPAPRYLN